MSKKFVGAGIALILLIVVGVMGHRYTFYREFDHYLKSVYPDKSFRLHWVKYDFLYGKFYTTVYCETDGTNFYIRKNGDVISEEYLETRTWAKMNKALSDYLETEAVQRYIRTVRAGMKDAVIVDVNGEIDYRKLTDRIYVYFDGDKIPDNEAFAAAAYETIQTLKKGGFAFEKIEFTLERKNEVFELRLKGEDINKSLKDLNIMIRKIK